MFSELKYIYSCCTCKKDSCPCKDQFKNDNFGCKLYELDSDKIKSTITEFLNVLTLINPNIKKFIGGTLRQEFSYVGNILLTHSDINEYHEIIDNSKNPVVTNVFYFENGIGKRGFTIISELEDDTAKVSNIIIIDEFVMDKILRGILEN